MVPGGKRFESNSFSAKVSGRVDLGRLGLKSIS